jgi:hypothetical protein
VEADVALNNSRGDVTRGCSGPHRDGEVLPEDLRRRFAIRARAWVVFVGCFGALVIILVGAGWSSNAPAWIDLLFLAAPVLAMWFLLQRTAVGVSITRGDATLLLHRTRLGRTSAVDPIVGSVLKWSMACVIPVPEKTLFVQVRKDDGTTADVPVAAAISPARRQELQDLHERLTHLLSARGDVP